MSDYTQTTDFSAKDALPSGNSNKKILGSDVDTEFSAISTAVGTKANKVGSPTANRVLAMDSDGDLSDAGFSKTPGDGLQVASNVLEMDINGLTNENTIDNSNDTVAFYDNSASALRKTAITNLKPSSASTSAEGIVELATQAEMESETASKVPTADLVKHNPGVAKAWASFSVSGGTPSLDANLNVSSITDDGVGLYTVNFSTAFSNANYAVGAWAHCGDAAGDHIVSAKSTDTKTTSALPLSVKDSSGNFEDVTELTVICMGDQ